MWLDGKFGLLKTENDGCEGSDKIRRHFSKESVSKWYTIYGLETHILLTEEWKHYAYPVLFLGDSLSGLMMEWSLQMTLELSSVGLATFSSCIKLILRLECWTSLGPQILRLTLSGKVRVITWIAATDFPKIHGILKEAHYLHSDGHGAWLTWVVALWHASLRVIWLSLVFFLFLPKITFNGKQLKPLSYIVHLQYQVLNNTNVYMLYDFMWFKSF